MFVSVQRQTLYDLLIVTVIHALFSQVCIERGTPYVW